MTTCNMKGVTHSEKPTENDQLTLNLPLLQCVFWHKQAMYFTDVSSLLFPFPLNPHIYEADSLSPETHAHLCVNSHHTVRICV